MDPFDYNFGRSLAVFAAASKAGEAVETRDALLTQHRAPVPDVNQCLLKRPTYKLERTLGRILDYQKRAGVPLRLHLASEHEGVRPILARHGAVEVDSIPAMRCDLAEPRSFAQDELVVGRVCDEGELSDFGLIAYTTFGFPVQLAPVVFTADLLGLPEVELFLGRVDGEPAACSMLFATGDVAGIYWVGVEERFRQRGFGAAVTGHAMAAGRKRGLRVASLQASKMGEPVYRRMGFEILRHYLRFDLPVR